MLEYFKKNWEKELPGYWEMLKYHLVFALGVFTASLIFLFA